MAKPFRQIRFLTEYAALRGALFALDRLSPAAGMALMGTLGAGWYGLNTARSRTARANILRAGITADPREADRIARASFRHFAVLVWESLRAPALLTPDTWRERVDLDIAPAAMAALQDPAQGLILVTGHLGNWEVGAHCASTIKPMVAIARTMKNPHVEALMARRNARGAIRTIPKYGAGARGFINVLKNGHILAILIDQYARDHRMMIDFLGVPSATYTTPAVLHLVTGAPILFALMVRTGPMRFRLRFDDPIVHPRSGDRQGDLRQILETINARLGEAVRRNPEQYLWAHRRWRD